MKGQLIVILKSAAPRLSTLFHELKEIIVMSIQWRKLFIIFSARSNQQIWLKFSLTYCNGMIIYPLLICTNHFMASAGLCVHVVKCCYVHWLTHTCSCLWEQCFILLYMYHSAGLAKHWKTRTHYQTLLPPFVQLGLVLLNMGPALYTQNKDRAVIKKEIEASYHPTLQFSSVFFVFLLHLASWLYLGCLLPLIIF